MVFSECLIFAIVTTSACAIPTSRADENKKTSLITKETNEISNDLKTASSSYSHQYSNWGGRNPGSFGYSVTGFGTIDDKYTVDPLYKDFDNSVKYNSYPGFANSGGFGPSGYGPTALEGRIRGGYDGYTGSGYGVSGSGYGIGSRGYDVGTGGYGIGSSGYGVGSSGYGTGSNGYGVDNSGYGIGGRPYGVGSNAVSGYSGSYGGNGGYGGYGGNGGLNSYYGYNNPNYQGAGHLGYGYQTKKLGYGNIYNSGITPSLVTGYRGYTRR